MYIRSLSIGDPKADMTIRDDIIAQAKNESTDRGKLMFLGNGAVVPVPGTLNQVYATDIDGHVSIIYNTVTPNNLNYPVWVKQIDKKMQVTGAWDVYNTYVAPKVGPHWQTHAWGVWGNDIVPVAGDQWTPWIVQPATTTDFTINILRTAIYTSGGWVAASTETHDMTSHIPGSAGARYVLISVAADGTLVYTDGTIEATPSALTPADIPVPPAGNRPLYAVMLYHGMIAPLHYTPDPTTSNFIDLRHMPLITAGSMPTLTGERIVITDGSGAITTDADLIWDAINNCFYMGDAAAYGVIYQAALGGSSTNELISNIVSPVYGAFAFGASISASFKGFRARGTSSAPSPVLINDLLAKFRGAGQYDTTLHHWSNTVSEIRLVADENFTATNQGTRIELWGTPAGATTEQLLVTIYGDGRIVSANDIEITDATKGIILKDTVTGIRYRVSVTSGAVVAVPV
jgi:hypothetical protein